MIKSSGFRISPTEIEDAVSNSGIVSHVFAYGAPDDTLGHAVEIAVTGRDDQSLDLDQPKRIA